MPDGGFGIKFEVSLRHGINVHSNPEASESGQGVLYSMDEETTSNKRVREDPADQDSKRIRVA